ncbi:MAG TPA: TonB-dependent receptor [Vicinamibacterales bacterium]|nr:TonB-dependent receptor [Vicinamibacterales bacterium]
MPTIRHFLLKTPRIAAGLSILLLAIATAAAAQETRGTIFGSVRDASGGVLQGVPIVVTNDDTNIRNEGVTNASGAFEIPYLLPGTYTVSAELGGFKKFTQTSLVLAVNTRAEVQITLELGAMTDEVTVTANATQLATTASASQTFTNRQVNSLPMYSNSAALLARSVPGIQWVAPANYLGLHSNVGASAITVAGGVGGNEYSLDGVPNAAGGRRMGYLPYTDTVAEIKVETAGFDASKGHSSGANISMLTKSGTNSYRGSASWQYWNPQWNATPSTTNLAYYGRIEQAEREGRTADAARFRSAPKVAPGRSNSWAGVVGGPVWLPKVFKGTDKLFFFFSYNGFKDQKSEEPTNVNRTVPAEAHRRGDFSDLLRLDPVRYQIYDPRTARLEGGRVVRDPFPNNQVPILNPLYAAYLPFFPMPNNPTGIVDAEGRNNYLAAGTPYNWDYVAYSNRIDWKLSARHRSFARWSYNDFLEDRGDWTYETMRGLHAANLVRQNIGATIDHVFIQNSSTIWNVSVAYNRFREGNSRNPIQQSFSPSAVGLPAYVDERAAQGPCRALPTLNFSAYTQMGVGCGGFVNYSIGTVKGDLTKLLGTHSVRSGVDLRMHSRANTPGGSYAGNFQFRNNYVRQRDDTTTAGTLGLEWAAFMLAVPTSVALDNNASYNLSNPYYAGFVQDDWRVTRRLSLNLGVRYEFEGGFGERDNKGIGGGFNFGSELPISAAAEAAYLRNPIPGLPSIQVRGGNRYLGVDSPSSLTKGQHDVLPRAGVVFKLDDKTVLRGGYGLFVDTNNVLNDSINQFGYTRGTSTSLTNDLGLTFNNADLRAGRTIFSDPFPVRADGTRFNTPFGNALGPMALVGRGLTFEDPNLKRARQQRWRVGAQRELTSHIVAEAAYLGAYSDRIGLSLPLSYLPEEYWADGLVRNDATAAFLNATFPNPFHISNFAFLQQQNPALYNEMSTNSFYTNTTIRRHQLLREYPHMNGLTHGSAPLGKSQYHHVEMSLQQRTQRGIEWNVSYTRAWDRRRELFVDEFDRLPSWRSGNATAPHHLIVTTIVEFPFGEGKAWLSNPGILRALAGGWQVSGIYHLQSGQALNWPNAFYYGDNYDNILLPRGERDRARWFNTDGFERASGLQPAAFHRSVFPQRLPKLRADDMNQLDLRLTRGIKVPGNRRLEFMFDAINALNNVQWNAPSTTPSAANFGVVTSQRNEPRFLQFQLKFTF